MENYTKAYKLYEKGGASAVIDACSDGRLKYDKWGYCNPCETNQPIYESSCLVCGTIHQEKKRQKNFGTN